MGHNKGIAGAFSRALKEGTAHQSPIRSPILSNERQAIGKQ